MTSNSATPFDIERVLGQAGIQGWPVRLGEQQPAGARDLSAGRNEDAVVEGILSQAMWPR